MPSPTLHTQAPGSADPDKIRPETSSTPRQRAPASCILLFHELQTDLPPVSRLQGSEEEGADFPPPRILFLPLYTREEEGAQIFRPPNSSSRIILLLRHDGRITSTSPVCSRLLLPTQNRPAVADSTYIDTWIRRSRQDSFPDQFDPSPTRP
jgi:hypothetical protein